MKYTLATLLALCLTGAAHAQTLNITELFGFPCTPPLSSFCVDGAQPVALIQASDGNFYGVNQTSFAAHGTTVHPAGGTVFKITAAGQVTALYTFQRNTTTGFFDQGSNPAALAEGTDGFLYGVASTGGPTSASAGTVFKVSKSGSGFQVLQTFCTSCTTGGFPNNIIPGTDGNLYGTTTAGGFFPSNGSCEGLGCGVVFRLTPPGTYTVLHALNGTADDSVPLGVIQASDGNLYGTTRGTGTGTIFRVLPSSHQFTTIHNFPSGVSSLNRLAQASNGLLYGASRPVSSSTVTFYSSTLTGSVQSVLSLPLPSAKKFGVGPLLQASDGNLWTTSTVGGSSNLGQVLAISETGNIVHELPFNGTNGAYPVAGVIQATNGTLYGTSTDRGVDAKGNVAFGTVFTIAGLPIP